MFLFQHVASALNLAKIYHATDTFEVEGIDNGQVRMQRRLNAKFKNAFEICFRHVDTLIEDGQDPDLGLDIKWALIYTEQRLLGTRGAFRQTKGLIAAEHFICKRNIVSKDRNKIANAMDYSGEEDIDGSVVSNDEQEV